MFEVYVDNRDGTVWDLSRIIASMKIKSGRVGKATIVDISFVKNSPFSDPTFRYGCGDIIRIRKDNLNIFYGFIFSVDEDEHDAVKITAYDQVRYLMNKDSMYTTNLTATQMVQKIVQETQLNAGTLADTKHVIPKIAEDNQSYIDMICKALDTTMLAGKGLYVFYDDFGSLTLRPLAEMALDIVIGEKSLMYSYKDKRSIDNDTYNQIKLYQDNKEKGVREDHVLKDSASIAKWGVLQLYQSVDEKMNAAQIKEMQDKLMQLKNREKRSLKVDALGDIRIRAGHVIWLAFESKGIKQQYVVNECTHTFDGDKHTMSLDLVVYGTYRGGAG
ncbi:XkdQ/YqbQ family protein [Paenibacillus sp. SYP-B4298]|uniref:XkdQ/YqbQ family protein n=1 Tax=Paenibacillus sp. SYP-B4298 TaxID=2996034 RepID=UPI0022DE7904|nr:hypothetical protein [Paenibacillus sp. SYP-B4298]